jgi:hypothetical protein
MVPAAVSPDPFVILDDESSSAALLRSIRESARVTKAWWEKADVRVLSDVEGSGKVVVDPACGLPTVIPDFETYQKMWGKVRSPLDFEWEDYYVTRFGSFMYLEYAVDTLEEQRDLYKGDEITKGCMIFVFFNEFIEKLRRLYWKDAEEVSQVSRLLNDVGLGDNE